MSDITETRAFWAIAAFTLAATTLWVAKDGGAVRGILMIATMLASANFGAKCVRATLAPN